MLMVAAACSTRLRIARRRSRAPSASIWHGATTSTSIFSPATDGGAHMLAGHAFPTGKKTQPDPISQQTKRRRTGLIQAWSVRDRCLGASGTKCPQRAAASVRSTGRSPTAIAVPPPAARSRCDSTRPTKSLRFDIMRSRPRSRAVVWPFNSPPAGDPSRRVGSPSPRCHTAEYRTAHRQRAMRG